jgi:hypothetical protein
MSILDYCSHCDKQVEVAEYHKPGVTEWVCKICGKVCDEDFDDEDVWDDHDNEPTGSCDHCGCDVWDNADLCDECEFRVDESGDWGDYE